MAVVLLGFVFATCPDEPLSFRPNSTDVKLSGSGRMWEYYHFLVDFAAPIASHMARAPAPEHCPKRLLLPMRDVFYLTNRWNNGRSVQAHFDALFAGLNLELVHVGPGGGGAAALGVHAMQAGFRDATPLDWNPHVNSPWSSDHAEVYAALRARAWRVARVGDDPAARLTPLPVLIVRRGRQGGARATGYDRRHLEPEFFASAAAFLTARRVAHAVVELDNLSLHAQVALFARARTVVGMHGAGLTNMVFMPRGARVIELGRNAKYALSESCYRTLAAKLGLAYVHLEATEFGGALRELLAAIPEHAAAAHLQYDFAHDSDGIGGFGREKQTNDD